MRDPASGKYTKQQEGVEFARYLTEEGWHIIPIKAADQLVRHVQRRYPLLLPGLVRRRALLLVSMLFVCARYPHTCVCQVLEVARA